jgi:hypothetical protein
MTEQDKKLETKFDSFSEELRQLSTEIDEVSGKMLALVSDVADIEDFVEENYNSHSKWPNDTIYVNDIIDIAIKALGDPGGGYHAGQLREMIELKTALSNANVTTLDTLTTLINEND